MKARYLGESDPLELIHGKVYDVVGQEEIDGILCFMVVDETGEDYPYEPEDFEIIEA